jgi:glycosyltransferase involved in cell wall biosynthesis
MKIGFVNQPIDTIVPPSQNSVGYYTYGVARPLAKYCAVVVYGLADWHKDTKTQGVDQNLCFKFLRSTQSDRLLYSGRKKYSKLVQTSSPMSTSTWQFPAFGRQVAIDLREQRCDVIHVQHCSQYVPVIRAFNPTAKIVLHLHAEWFSQSNFEVLKRRLDQVDLLLTVSDHITAKTRRDFPSIQDRCETMYYGIDPKEFVREKDYSMAKQRREKRLLFVGAISPQKGPHVLLDAFNIVVERYPHIRLDLVGYLGNYPIEESFDRNDQQLLKSVAPFYAKNCLSRFKAKLSLAPSDAGTYQSYLKAKLAGDIVSKVSFPGFTGIRGELVDHYYNADIFAFTPIWNEGFGIPPVEAMAAGLPVVASRSGALVETVKHEQTGLLVDKNDSKGLSEALLELLQNDALRETLGRAGRRWAHEQFAWDRIAERMYQRYATVCGLLPKGTVCA